MLALLGIDSSDSSKGLRSRKPTAAPDRFVCCDCYSDTPSSLPFYLQLKGYHPSCEESPFSVPISCYKHAVRLSITDLFWLPTPGACRVQHPAFPLHSPRPWRCQRAYPAFRCVCRAWSKLCHDTSGTTRGCGKFAIGRRFCAKSQTAGGTAVADKGFRYLRIPIQADQNVVK